MRPASAARQELSTRIRERTTVDRVIGAAQNLVFKKSTKCGESYCVEVAVTDDVAFMRDSKQPNTGHLSFDATTWSGFMSDLKAGRFSPNN
jgi:hypothetical protein